MTTREHKNAQHIAAKLMLDAAKELDRASDRIIELEKILDKRWIAVAVELPIPEKKVLVCDYRVEGRPDLDNTRITYLTKDCLTQEVIWFGGRKPNWKNELWQYLDEPPLQIEIQRQITVAEQKDLKQNEQTVRFQHH